MKNVLRLLCGWMAIALAACTGDELQQIAPLQKPVGERVISVDAYTPSDDAHTRLDFEESTEGLKFSWSENDAFTAVIGNEEVTFSYDVNSKQFTATNVAENIELTDGIVAYYPAYTGEYSTDLSEQTGALNSAKTFMEGTYHVASNSFTFAHSTAILKATFSGLPQDAVVSSIKIGAAPYTISIPYAEGMDLAEKGIYIYLPNVAKDENIVFSVTTTAGEVYTATQPVKLDEGIKVGTYYVAPITLTSATCNLPTGSEFNTAIEGFLEENSSLTQIEFIANSVNTDKSNPVGRSNAYMVANEETLEIHTAALQFVFDADCEDMFSGLSTITAIDFGDNIDTSNVTNMSWMFRGCSSLKSLNLSGFNTSEVEEMNDMFSGCSSLESINFGDNFNTANVTTMQNMFYDCSSLTSLNVSNFDTGMVESMKCMFSTCEALTTLNLSNFNTANVTDMGDMFANCSSLTSLNLSNFNTANVTNMQSMFYGCSSLTSLDFGDNFNTANVTSMGSMFRDCSSLTSLNLSSFNTSKVTSMSSMFRDCSSLTSLNLSSFNTANVTNMSWMFYGCSLLTSIDLSSFVLSSNPNLYYIFNGLGSGLLNEAKTQICVISTESAWTADLLTNSKAEYIFPTCNLPTGSDFNTVIAGFLQENTSLTQIKFIANSVNTDKSNQIGSSNAYMVANGNVLEIHTAAPNFVFNENCLSMFYNLSSITAINFGNNIDTSQVTNMSCMFHYCLLLTTIEFGDNFDTSKVTDMSCMFMHCYKLTSLNVSNFDTSKVTNMNRVFEGCENLSSLNVSNFNTSKVEYMNFMFSGCSKLSKLDLSNFNTSKVTSMFKMFKNCFNLTSLDLSSFRLSSSPDLSDVFHGLGSGLLNETKTQICVISTELAWTADLLTNSNAEYIFPTCNLPTGSVFKSAIAGFLQGKELTQIKFIVNSANVNKTAQIGSSNAYMMANGNVLEVHTAAPKFVFNAECDDMFSGLNTITAIDFGDNVDTSNVTSMYGMFSGCSSLTSLNLSGFNTSNVTTMGDMFYQCNALTMLNVSSFNTSKVTTMSYMFAECHNIAELNVSSFNTSQVTNMSYMFAECHNMAELDLSSFDFGMVAAFKDMFYLFAKDDPYQVPVYVYVKNGNDKTLLESAETGINSNYAIFMVK